MSNPFADIAAGIRESEKSKNHLVESTNQMLREAQRESQNPFADIAAGIKQREEKEAKKRLKQVAFQGFGGAFMPGQGQIDFKAVGEEFEQRREDLINAAARGIANVGSGFAGVFGSEENAQVLWDVAKSPELASTSDDMLGTVIDMIGETLPYITATTAAGLATGGLGFAAIGGFAVGSIVEGNSAYREALDAGVSEGKAKAIGVGVGIISGAIEAFGGAGAEKLASRAISKLNSKMAKKGATFTVGMAIEALEEGAQELTAITGETTYRDVNWDEGVKRVAGSMAGGAFLGGVFKGADISARRLSQAGKVKKVEKAALLTADGSKEFATNNPHAAARLAQQEALGREDLRKAGIKGNWSAAERKQLSVNMKEIIAGQEEAAFAQRKPEQEIEQGFVDREAEREFRESTAELGVKEGVETPGVTEVEAKPEKIKFRKVSPVRKAKELSAEIKEKVEKKKFKKAEPKKTEDVTVKPLKSKGLKDKQFATVEEIEGTGKPKKRGLAKSLDAAGTEKGLTSFFEDIEEFKSVNLKEQARAVTELINTDPERARRIAMGEEVAPKGVVPEMVLVGMSEKAIREGDTDALRDIALGSKLVQEATTMGQRIRALGELGDTSPVKAMQGVAAKREKAYRKGDKKADAKKAKKESVKKIKESIKKAKPDNGNRALNNFIASLQC